MPKLALNIDHVATLREARKGSEPEPIGIAIIAEQTGVDGIVVHLREDRRHIQDRDLELLRKLVKTQLNLEMAAIPEMVNIAKAIKPDLVTLVPERREEITTEGGLDIVSHMEEIKDVISELKESQIPVSIFIDPDLRQINIAKEIGSSCIEINTGKYSEAKTHREQGDELIKIQESAKEGLRIGLEVRAGHGLNYQNVRNISIIPEIKELSIGHSIISRSIFVGIYRAIREMLTLVKS